MQQELVQEADIARFNQVDTLQAYGINAADLNKLKSAGLCTVLGILMTTRKELVNIKGLSDAKIDKIIEAAQKVETAASMTGVVLRNKRAQVFKLATGSTALDQLLGGGIESMSITEAYGEFRSGKTQLAMTLCVTSQMSKEDGGGEGKVAYIDTEGAFRPERLEQIASRFQMDGEQVLENVLYARAYTVDHMFSLLTMVAAKMMEEPFALLIIDSIMSLFRVDFSGRGELSERQQLLGRMLSRIMKISEQFNIAVFLTNQVMADPGANVSFVPDPKKPVGGHILAHASTTRLYLRKGRGEQRICKIIDSPCLPESEATFQIGIGGVEDSSD